MLLVASCSGTADTGPAGGEQVTITSAAPGGEDAPPTPELDPALVAAGEPLYQARCAVCHGADLSGHPDWKTPNDDGTPRPPPHDSTGHTWHHPDQLLVEIVRDGGSLPTSPMPPFEGILSDDEIGAVLEFIKSSWGPDERRFQWQVTWQQQRADG